MVLVQDGLSIPWGTPCFLCHSPINLKDSMGEDVMWTYLILQAEGIVPVHDACVGANPANWELTEDAA